MGNVRRMCFTTPLHASSASSCHQDTEDQAYQKQSKPNLRATSGSEAATAVVQQPAAGGLSPHHPDDAYFSQSITLQAASRSGLTDQKPSGQQVHTGVASLAAACRGRIGLQACPCVTRLGQRCSAEGSRVAGQLLELPTASEQRLQGGPAS